MKEKVVYFRWYFQEQFMQIGVVLIISNNQMLQQKGSSSSSKEQEKVLNLSNMTCALRNSQIIQERQNQDAGSDYLVNYPSEFRDNIISKIIELRFPHHTITIKDYIQLTFHHSNDVPKNQKSQNLNQSKEEASNQEKRKQTKKLVLFRNKNRTQITSIKGDKKNIAKNVVIAFMNFLKDRKREGHNFETHIESIKSLIEKTKFNNHLLHEIISNQEFRPQFRDFLSNHARSWVDQSKIKNKEIHLQAISRYEQICEQQDHMMQQSQKKQRYIPQQQNNDQYLFQSNINHQLEDQIKDFK